MLVIASVVLAGSQSGCSLAVMAGKMFFGDPKITCAFTSRTGVDLVKDEKKLLVVCTVPEAVRAEAPSLEVDLIESVSRRLKTRRIPLVDSDDVATWLDDNGGTWGTPNELAEQFQADFIVHIDVDGFSDREEHSPSLLRGRANGTVFVYEVETSETGRTAREVLIQEFRNEHPKNHPVTSDRVSTRLFHRQYIDRLSAQLSQMFYNHRMSEMVE